MRPASGPLSRWRWAASADEVASVPGRDIISRRAGQGAASPPVVGQGVVAELDPRCVPALSCPLFLSRRIIAGPVT